VSYGAVDGDEDGNAKIHLKDDDGNPPPYGPLVEVTLQPSSVSIPCRLAHDVAGNGEADFYPFVAGDEVIVAIMQGMESAGGVILGRLNQEIDAWPTVVAGQDATKNNFGFRRMRAPYMIETSAAYVIRSATTGSQIGIDDKGQVIINDGDKGNLVIGAEGIGFASGDGSCLVQIYPADKEALIVADTASLNVAAKETKFISQGAISFATNGAMPNQTAVTAEQVVALFINVLAFLASQGSFAAGALSPSNYPTISPQACQTQLALVMQSALAALATPTPVGPAPVGEFLEFQGLGVFGQAGAITAAMSNPLAPVDVTGSVFGFGRPGFRL
jgi:hypothetical protein